MHFHTNISIFIQFLHRGNSISSYQTINFCLKISVLDDNEEKRYSVPSSFPYQFVNEIQNVARLGCVAKSINNIPSRIFCARFDLHLDKGKTRLNLSRLRGNEREGRNALFVNRAVSSFHRTRKLNHRRTKKFKINSS